MNFKHLIKEFSELSSPEIMRAWGEVLEDLMEELEEHDEELYWEFYKKFYLKTFGPHLRWDTLNKWVKNMKNEDGTTGEHWSLAETTQVATKYNVDFSHFTKEEWYAVLNMVYSDFFGAIPDSIDSYVKLAWKWLEDKDIPDGKLYYYYCDVVKAND